ncbi:N-acetylneuraminic acid mutarotase [Algoriphagus ratkowskyi]|uniref:Galactose oxidase n=1 Tax=Algoriphagus ratkowskyi TaxID=57028 RepID=A0A2W7QTK1_9BACT|nr:kelch repeat-containing protein [Algoriphagus ratkowskyi]PZX50486.1 N-acetylneuraminic acid mutarotase [Algoriphagus ratkowskyi]TXD75707.1 galactose oxidase [Algoriphagus ratkowskyi]
MKHFLIAAFLLISLTAFAQSNEQWTAVETVNYPLPRHENSFVENKGKFYLLGGRGIKPIEEYNPKTKTWKTLAMAPIEFHHFQAVSFKNEIYVIGAMTGNYPHETPLTHFLIFNPKTNSWREGAEIPEERRRGSVGVVVRGDKFYLVCGIVDGHYADFVPWFDEYDTKTKTWKILPDSPRPRDHFGAVLVEDKIYAAGGRTSHAEIGKVLDLVIPEVDFYDFKTNSWSTVSAGLPTPRGGTSSIAKGPFMVVMNGESKVQESSHSEVEVLDTRSGKWFSLPSLNQGRHGTGVIYYKGKLYVAAGSAKRGGGPELNTMEVLEWK